MKELDRQTGEAAGWTLRPEGNYNFWYDENNHHRTIEDAYSPSTNWQQCGELIERFKIELRPAIDGSSWKASIWRGGYEIYGFGDTPQEAVCRAVIAMQVGEVEEYRGER